MLLNDSFDNLAAICRLIWNEGSHCRTVAKLERGLLPENLNIRISNVFALASIQAVR
jgi:hypothetical protein